MKNKLSLVVVGLCLIGVCVGIYFLVLKDKDNGKGAGGDGQGGGKKGGQVTLSDAEVATLVELKNRSIARLENGPANVTVDNRKQSGLEVAADGFTSIGEQVPAELLPWQNLAIARWLILENVREDSKTARQSALQAVERLQEVDPDSAVASWLKAKMYLHVAPDEFRVDMTDRRRRAVETLKQGVEKHPDNAWLWFALYNALQNDSSESAAAEQALEKTHQLLPDNLYVLTEWMVYLATRNDERIWNVIENAKEVVRPLSSRVQQRVRLTSDALFERAEQQRERIRQMAMVIQQAVRPDEISKSDQKIVEPHPLEFVIYGFKDAKLQPADTVALTPGEITIVEHLQIAEQANVRDMLVADFDLDGWVDAWILYDDRLEIYRSDAERQTWGKGWEVELAKGMKGFVAADLDRDKNYAARTKAGETQSLDRILPVGVACHESGMDIVVYGQSGVVVVQNKVDAEGVRTLVPQPQSEGLDQLQAINEVLLVDFDHDYDLDLVVSGDAGTSLWLGMGQFQFTDLTEFSQFDEQSGYLQSMIAVDIDRDVDIDIVAVTNNGSLGYLENLRHARFRWRLLGDEFPATSQAQACAVADVDGNASWDILVADQQGLHLWRTRTPRPGTLSFLDSHTTDADLDTLQLADLDNNGRQDLIGRKAGELSLWHCPDGEKFVAWENVLSALQVTALDVEDVDHDGDLDLLAGTAKGTQWWDNEGGNQNNWINIYPVGQDDNRGRCNRNAYGSLIEVKTGTDYQEQVVNRQVMHFGIGKAEQADVIRFLWTNGVPQSELAVEKNVGICEKMELKGSCPFIYTWDGEQFAFFSDCLWAAPIGMQMAEGVTAPSRPWEYLRIPGSALKQKEGGYELLLTEELWEAAYFDKVELIAIDHPEDLEIFSNEKVGPPSIAEYRVRTVRERRRPRSVKDDDGVERLEKVVRRDGQFLAPFTEQIRQGLTAPHTMEIDLGDLGDSPRVTLYLTGWILPTDTSLNVGFSQDQLLDGPQPPTLWVVNEQGEWQQAIDVVGFPGGKTKTIAIDLHDKFLTDDFRVQLRTSAEIYWDEIFFTLNETDVSCSTMTLPLESADLQYRGFSELTPNGNDSPQSYNGNVVSLQPKWPPMDGRFTRYGDVRELLLSADDQMVVLGAGDAIHVRFSASAAADLPPGWKRDFFLHSVGWDKDADLNTYYGQSAEPLPFRGMQSYPYGEQDQAPDSPEYRDYLRRYQTRRQNPAKFWKQLAAPLE